MSDSKVGSASAKSSPSTSKKTQSAPEAAPRKAPGLVALPQGSGWHYARVHAIVAVKHVSAQKSAVFLDGGIQLDVSEDSHVVNKRIEDFIAQLG